MTTLGGGGAILAVNTNILNNWSPTIRKVHAFRKKSAYIILLSTCFLKYMLFVRSLRILFHKNMTLRQFSISSKGFQLKFLARFSTGKQATTSYNILFTKVTMSVV